MSEFTLMIIVLVLAGAFNLIGIYQIVKALLKLKGKK